MKTATELMGATPQAEVRPVSLAVRRYLQDFSGAGGLVIAVSGGADSLALAVAAIDQARRLGLPTRTVTVDHGIRPESAAESRAVAALMSELGATEAVVVGGIVESAAGPEADARSLRYRCLFDQMQSFAVDHTLDHVELLLGHTLDDQAETVLLRLARGAGATSLGAIKRRMMLEQPGAWLGRPLLDVRRKQTVGFCGALDLPVVNDPTNRVDGPWTTADGNPLRRAAVREWALPALNRALGQDVAPALARTARQLQEDDQALQEWATSVLEEASAKGERYDVAILAGVPAAVRKRALRMVALGVGVPAGAIMAVHLGFLEALVVDWHGQGPVILPGGISVSRVAGQLVAARRRA